MLFCQLDTGAVEAIGIVVTVGGATLGSYVAVRVGLASLAAEVANLSKWLTKVADGDTKTIGTIQATLADHGRDRRLGKRLGHLELEHAARMGRCMEEPA